MERPRIVMYPRWTALRRVVLEGEQRQRETYVAKVASLRLEMEGVVGLMVRVRVRVRRRVRVRIRRRAGRSSA
jgi:hypothetical protein